MSVRWMDKVASFEKNLAELTEEQREAVNKLWRISIKIAFWWRWCPLFSAFTASFLTFVWVGVSGYQLLPDFGFSPWAAGALWAAATFFFSLPLVKLLFLGHSKRLLKEFGNELMTAEGRQAFEFLTQPDIVLSTDCLRSAGSRKLYDWLSI